MKTLHTFGCSITQGFALPDVVNPVVNQQGRPLTPKEIDDQKIEINWEDVHILKPSDYAWPSVLAQHLGMRVQNYARRGACFQQIARQCAVEVKNIQPDDTVIVMWTYLSRLSMQWPARTSVPFGNLADYHNGWRTVMVGFNRFFGLSGSTTQTSHTDQRIQKYIHDSTKNTYLDPMGVYDRYYNNLILQTVTDGFLRATGARVIHLSVEPHASVEYLEDTRQQLDNSLKQPYNIPHPDLWYNISVDHTSCVTLLDPRIPPAENDTHPSVTHHHNFAEVIRDRYFNHTGARA
jgi:hypothetical protein